jgi:hypothetical protein
MKFTVIIIPLLIISCASNFHTFKKQDIMTRIIERDLSVKLNTYKPESVYVVNNGLKREQNILDLSGLFVYVEDSTKYSKVILRPIQERIFRCGTPIILTFLTFGFFPGFLPQQYDYEFLKIKNMDSTDYKISVEGYVSISNWNLFTKPFRNENKLIGKRLKEQYVLGNTSWKKQFWIHY